MSPQKSGAAVKDIQESYTERRMRLLAGLDPLVVSKAWFTLSHLLLDDGATVVDMGCNTGDMTYAMAAMAPQVDFIGLDKSRRQVNKAKEKHRLDNLDFRIGDVASEIFEEESLDAIINSYVLHEVYSASRYNERIISDTLKKHFRMLKKGGMMFIRDYARPPPEQYVMLEIPDKESTGTELEQLSDVDLLLWYSQHARPRMDPGCGGFFCDELPARNPGTRLFRMPFKWAYEFIMRKDDRKHWESELPVEYTFFMEQEFRKELDVIGARVQYSGPYWDEMIIERRFENKFRLYDDRGQLMGPPPTCYISLAVKLAERKSLKIRERRPSRDGECNLRISTMRDEKTGRQAEIVSRDTEVHEILPYRVEDDGRLKIYIHDGVARSIVNAVARRGINIDGRRWSGHMIEPISVDGEAISTLAEKTAETTLNFSKRYLGLKPKPGRVIMSGPDYYPAPDYIDERIHTYYLEVERARGRIMPRTLIGHTERFQAKGEIREVEAQQILNAIAVGLIPNARLELQILSLFEYLKIPPENWQARQISLQASKITSQVKLRKLLDSYGMEKARFRKSKGKTGDLQPIHSTFVEEVQSRGAITGITAQDMDFVVFSQNTINTAVVLPLRDDLKQDVHAGFLLEHLPVPQRFEGKSLTVSVPSYNLPPEINNTRAAKKFIAEQFDVLPEMVIKLGESYFSHLGVTPQRIHPFGVTVPPKWPDKPEIMFLPFYQLMMLRKSIAKSTHFMVLVARAYRFMHERMRLDAKLQAKAIIKERFETSKPEWSLPLHYVSFLPAPGAEKPPTVNNDQDKVLTTAPDTSQPAQDNPKARSAAEPSKSESPEVTEDFVEEFSEFLTTLDQLDQTGPRPEKW